MSGAVASSVDGRRFTFESPNEELGTAAGRVRRLRRISRPGSRGGARRPRLRAGWGHPPRPRGQAVRRGTDRSGRPGTSRCVAGDGAPAAGGARRRRARAPAGAAVRARRERVRPAHVPLRPVGLGQDVRAGVGARAAAARDRAADRRARPELGLRPAGRGARRVDDELASRYRRRRRLVGVAATAEGADRLHVRFARLDPRGAGRAAAARPDRRPRGARRARLRCSSDREARRRSRDAARVEARPGSAGSRAGCATSASRAGGVWARGDAGSVLDRVATGGPRCLVSTSARSPRPRSRRSSARRCWRALAAPRRAREPILIVIDEAHNVCPRDPAEPADRARHRARRPDRRRGPQVRALPAGRRTQRPQKVHENVVSQCDNLVLMRMTSAADLAYVAETLSFAPPAAARAGDGVRPGRVARGRQDRLAPSGAVRFGPRIAEEGGSDVPTAWASPVSPP